MNDTPVLGHMIDRSVIDITDQGAFVDGGGYGSLFIPRRQLPHDLKIGDKLRVFLYNDSGRILATARHPYLECGMVGRLTVTSIDCGTVYMDLGIPKELVVPISEQRSSFEVGQSVLIMIQIDDEGRLFGTQRYNRYIRDVANKGEFKVGQKVDAVAVSHTPLGFRTVVNDSVYGLIYKTDVKIPLKIGKRMSAYISKVREDGKIDLSLSEPGISSLQHAASTIMRILKRANSFIPFTNKSVHQDIQHYLHMSKGKFKKAVGILYKQHIIEIRDDGIRLIKEDKD